MIINTVEKLKPLSDFKFAFVLYEDGSWMAYNTETDYYYKVDDDAVKDEFKAYKEERPEYIYKLFRHLALGNKLNEEDYEFFKHLGLKDMFENLLAYSMIANEVEQDIAWKKAMRLVNWLRGTNFYESPASTIYHEAYVGGLLSHTLTVAKVILCLQQSRPFESVSPEDALFVALTHDFCKIGIYQPYEKWFKDDNNQWQTKLSFKREESVVPFGHGESTMYILQKFKSLKLEPALAIRWHMGAWRVTDSDMNDLQHANETYPLVHLLQFADQLSITDYIRNVGEPFISV